MFHIFYTAFVIISILSLLATIHSDYTSRIRASDDESTSDTTYEIGNKSSRTDAISLALYDDINNCNNGTYRQRWS